MKKKVIFSTIIVGLVIISIAIGWGIKHPKCLPIDKINTENASLRKEGYTKDNIKDILIELEKFQFKRNRRSDDAVGWTLAINWNDDGKIKWITLYEDCIEYEGYIYLTDHVKEYSEYQSQLLLYFTDIYDETTI